jgi:hypothetical protein
LFAVVRLLEGAREKGKEEENDTVNNIKIHHICVGTRQNKTVKQYGVRGKGKEE